MNINTPHSVVLQMMKDVCYHCGKPLDWTKLGRGLTPHLDHDHETGEVNGFSHPSCNPRAMKDRIEKLLAENAKLKTELEEYRQAEPLVFKIAA